MKRLLRLWIWGILFWASPVYADSPSPRYSYAKTTANGQYVWVMLAPGRHENVAHWIPSFADKIKRIRKKYSKSGMYRLNDSKNPLWTVDWYAFGVEPCSDGRHLVRWGPWASDYGTEALSFWSNGQVLRLYTIQELVTVPEALPHSVSHFTWRERSHLDEAKQILHLSTLHGDIYQFDLHTGRILSAMRPVGWEFNGLLSVNTGIGIGIDDCPTCL